MLTLLTALSLVAVVATGVLLGSTPSDAATITAAYRAGHRNVAVNDYGTPGLGVFVMRGDAGDPAPGTERIALCIDAVQGHSTASGAYRQVTNRVISPELDYLVWKYAHPGHPEYEAVGNDHDTATALAALAWYYAQVTRRGGGLVWSDWSRGFTPISPVSPHPWNALPRFSLSHPVGLRSNGADLDAAERRVHELFVEAEARRGPWVMSAVRLTADRASVTVTGPGGPIRNLRGVRFVFRDSDDRIVATRSVVTDRNGVAMVPRTDLQAGGSVAGTVTVTVPAPGVHEEWDGDGPIQRMATATGTLLHRRVVVTPAPVYLQVAKRSSDATLSPGGGRFAVIDADGNVVATAVSDRHGTATFPAIDPGSHRPPYSVRELAAPAGLLRRTTDLVVDGPYSSDPRAPTTVEVVNHPRQHQLRVRKVLSDPGVGPGDMEGFSFSVTRVADGRELGQVTTLHDGWAPPLTVAAGDVEICEIDRPPWAAGLVDPGCREVSIASDGDEHVEVTYTNVVPTPSMTTRARDRTDGDQVVAQGGGVVTDTVTLEDLVPGTQYRLDGELLAIEDDRAATATGISASMTFVADSPSASVEMTFEVPPLPGFSMAVVVQRLSVGGVTVLSHADLDDIDQTIWIPTVTTRASVVGSALPSLGRVGEQVIDVVSYQGLPPGRYDAHLVWHVRRDDGACTPTTMRSVTTFTAEPHGGSVTVGPLEIVAEAHGTALVAFQHLHRIDGPDGPDGMVAGDPQGAVLVHAACDDPDQTVWIPSLTTSVAHRTTTAPGTMTDSVTVSGLPRDRGERWTVKVVGGLHRHDALHPHDAPDRGRIEQQVCTHENRVAVINMDIAGPGTFTTPGEQHDTGRYSYAERLEVTDGQLRWESDWHGCAEADQTFVAASVESAPPPSELPSTTVATTVVSSSAVPVTADTDATPARRRALPRTGGGSAAVATALALLMSGAGGLALVAAARRRAGGVRRVE